MQPLNSLKVGTKFLVKKYGLQGFEKNQLIELGITPSSTLEIIQKNFSFVIIKCRGGKFALAESTAQQLMGYEA